MKYILSTQSAQVSWNLRNCMCGTSPRSVNANNSILATRKRDAHICSARDTLNEYLKQSANLGRAFPVRAQCNIILRPPQQHRRCATIKDDSHILSLSSRARFYCVLRRLTMVVACDRTFFMCYTLKSAGLITIPLYTNRVLRIMFMNSAYNLV